jgi:hypothetical protein
MWQYGAVLIIAMNMLVAIIKMVVRTASMGHDDSLTFQLRNNITVCS